MSDVIKKTDNSTRFEDKLKVINQMKFPIANILKDLWDRWDLRAFMMISLSLQTFLILFAPLRKRTATAWTMMPLWSAYLLADWAATFAVGLISNSQNGKPEKSNNNADLLAFWAPILLVHLGGPDTITAFSLEDNELWLRHLLTLITQSSAAVYVFFQSLPENQMWAPTVLMFISGLVKFFERRRSLYLASLNSFRDSMLKDPDPDPTYAKLMNEYHWKKEANLPTRIEMIPEPSGGAKGVNKVKEGDLNDQEVVLYAYRFFEIFKGLIVDLIFSLRERDQSRDFFLERNAQDAFKVIEVELNFIYDVLFTKVRVVYSSWGYFFRFVSFACIVASLGLFYCEDKYNFKNADVAITYSLLLGGIALDVISFITIITSDWLRVATKKLPIVNLNDGKKSADDKTSENQKNCFTKLAHVLRRRWCESVSTYNLISYCRNRCKIVKEEFISSFGLIKYLDSLRYVKQELFTKDLRNHIFKEMRRKSETDVDLDIAKALSAAKGDWALRFEGCSELFPFILDVDYDQSLLLWHIAIELCYRDEINDSKYRDFSKLLSDYMLYLLIMQPKMMSAVAGIGQIRFRNTCAEAGKFLDEQSRKRREKKPDAFKLILYGLRSFFKYLFYLLLWAFLFLPIFIIYVIFQLVKYVYGQKVQQWKTWKLADEYCFHFMMPWSSKKSDEEGQIRDCQEILNVYTEVEPVTIKGDRSKSVLFDGCILAKKLRGKENKWEIMSKVWVEMLSFAAIHCRANSHAQQLSRGGELITFVWLLMVHFGLGNQYQISEGHRRAKLIMDK